MLENYDKTIAEIQTTIAHSGDRINGLANDLNRAPVPGGGTQLTGDSG